jgi:hypothetical protein
MLPAYADMIYNMGLCSELEKETIKHYTGAC